MIQTEHIVTYGWDAAIRGMRNPLNSWDLSDSYASPAYAERGNGAFVIGDKDLELMHKLFVAGTDHRKFMRQIGISMDIIAPRYWWLEYDTYKVGTVSNSCSTMHTIMNKEFTKDDFSFDKLKCTADGDTINGVVGLLNEVREAYVDFDELVRDGDIIIKDEADKAAKKKLIWYSLIQILPQSYNQRRTVTMNYEVAVNMIRQRSNHKLDEWREFTEILMNLPYMKEIINGRDSN